MVADIDLMGIIYSLQIVMRISCYDSILLIPGAVEMAGRYKVTE